ncbi:MAG TPA: ATP-binding protein [Gemmatimonadales bacterium]|nr:ATP-binding protein [Gemmatimonadales bacterium]
MRWFGVKRAEATVPSPQTLLRAVYAGRISLAVAIYVTAAARVAVAQPLQVLVVSFVLIAAILFTAWSYWRSHFRAIPPSETFLYLQAIFDAALITTVVHMTGGADSDFATLYVPLIAVIAVLMPPQSTALVTTLVGLVYFADIFFGHRGAPIAPGLFIQLGVFAAVAAVTAYFASRVKVMGAEREALAGELQQVRLEADDVLRNLRTGVMTVDASGKLLYSNPAAEALLGFSADEWRDKPIMPELARLAPEFWAAIIATARRGVRLMRVEASVRRGDRVFPIGLTTTTIEGPKGDLPRVTAIFADISDSKRLQELHLRAERLEAVAELSSSLAHEIKNPLASIRSSVEQLSRSSRANADEKFLANLIVRESDRLSRLLSEFLDFSRVRVTEYRVLDLVEVAGAAARMIEEREDFPEGAEITLEGSPTPMEGDEDLVHRVVSNLVLNALQAAGTGARIEVRIGPASPGDLPSGAGIENPVRLQISDNGPGIPDAVRERLFEPFVTGRVGGTGLGLAIVQRAVEAHRGLVLVDSITGSGTTFTIFFPAARQREEAA